MPATINCEIYFQTDMYAFGCVWKTKKGKQKHTEKMLCVDDCADCAVLNE